VSTPKDLIAAMATMVPYSEAGTNESRADLTPFPLFRMAKWLAQAGVDLYTIQKLGRWKSISMVTRYAHHYPESLRAGVQVLDRVGKGIRTNLEQSKEKGATSSL